VSGLRVVVVGLGFGSSFVPIYQKHPAVASVGICDANPERLAAAAIRFSVESVYATLDDVLADASVDAVHLLTPVPFHFVQTMAVLGAGKHCACAVPMATELDHLHQIVEARRQAGKVYMMMETAVYTREFLYAQDLHARGALGNLTFLRGTYFQDLEGEYPAYWRGSPPMHYITHAIGPLLALAGRGATKVCCMGSGRLRPDIQVPGRNEFPLQTAIFRLRDSDIAAEVTRSWFQTARPYTEAFSVYGDAMGFEWQQIEDEEPAVYTLDPLQPGRWGRHVSIDRSPVPFRPDLLPPSLSEFADGGHGGSHPHLVHEFISAIVEGRPSRVDATIAADWTAPGICAHESSLRDGDPVVIPAF